jgi:hypothetical protein
VVCHSPPRSRGFGCQRLQIAQQHVMTWRQPARPATPYRWDHTGRRAGQWVPFTPAGPAPLPRTGFGEMKPEPRCGHPTMPGAMK